MTQRYQAHLVFSGNIEYEVSVSSDKCQYFVWIGENEAVLRGPGVREEGEKPFTTDKIDNEDFGILIVLLFENGLWPGD